MAVVQPVISHVHTLIMYLEIIQISICTTDCKTTTRLIQSVTICLIVEYE